MKKQILIADKRKELSTKYKKILESLDCNVIVASKPDLFLKLTQENEPELIIISDSIVEDLADFCKKIRVLTFNSRPVIIAMSKSAELEDRVNVLQNGADDFLSEPIASSEFKVRMLAHLRREQEKYIDERSGFENKNYTYKVLKRTLASGQKRAFMLVSIENMDEYRTLYTDLASEKLVKTYCTIIKSSLSEDDFAGQISDNKFLLITSPLVAERIASFLTFAFDNVATKFYCEQDLKRGYVILQGDDNEGRRSRFVRSAIGIVSNEFKTYNSPKEVFIALNEVHNFAILPEGSSYLVDRPQLKGFVSKKERNNNIFISEKDEALSFLLETTVKMQGYSVFTEIKSEIPSVVILDAGDKEEDLNQLKYTIKNIPKGTKIIVTSVMHEKEKILNMGADLYLPKPYNILTLLNRVKSFCDEYNK